MSVASALTPRPAAPHPNASQDVCLSIPRERYYRLTVEQYHQMIAAGILTSNDRVELLEGILVEKMSRNAPHDNTIVRIMRCLSRLLPDEWNLRVQTAVTLSNSEPEPDLAIVRGPLEAYDNCKPKPRDVVLLIEVADNSLMGDRNDKGSLYAAAKIPEYWIVNLVAKQVEVYSKPRAGKSPGYRDRVVYGGKDEITLVLDGIEVGRVRVVDSLP